jgi:ribosomal protein S27E
MSWLVMTPGRDFFEMGLVFFGGGRILWLWLFVMCLAPRIIFGRLRRIKNCQIKFFMGGSEISEISDLFAKQIYIEHNFVTVDPHGHFLETYCSSVHHATYYYMSSDQAIKCSICAQFGKKLLVRIPHISYST